MNVSSSRQRERRHKPPSLSIPKVKPLILTTMYEYTCYTKQGKFRFMADDDMDAMRKALWFCWRDGQDFIRIKYCKGCENYTLSILHIDKRDHECFTL